MTEDLGKFFEDIADDCFIECDELLSNIRRNLLKLDELSGGEKPSKSDLEDMLRNCHTLKGLTGMIGADQVMKLTHSLENYLKAIFEGHFSFTPNALDTVFSSVNMMEQQLAALRKKAELPDATAIIEEVDKLLPRSEIEKVNAKSTAQIISEGKVDTELNSNEADHDLNENKKIWKIFFTPTRELFDNGININEVRSRIQNIGEVLHCVPHPVKDGKITFEFKVSSEKPESLFQSWVKDGINYEAGKQETIEPVIPEGIEKSESILLKSSSKVSINQPFTQTNVIRVDLPKLDDIMRMVGDLVISRARLNDHIQTLTAGKKLIESRGLQETNILMERQLRDLREGVMRLRLVPVGEVFERMKFVLRDLIRESGKSISLDIIGHETQIDKFVVEKMLDPLLHLVRNAVSHGIETIEDRGAAGKPTDGKLVLKAFASGNGVIIEVEDNGRGLDKTKIKEKAVSMGIIDSDEVIDNTMLINILCTSGFSTRDKTDMISGRGVGMNVVKKTIQELGGSLDLETVKGQGTTFRITLPLTLSIVDALIVNVSGQVFAVPLPVVNEVIRFQKKELVKMENNEMISYRDIVLPVIKLSTFFNLEMNGNEVYDALVIGQGNDMAGLAVDRIIGQREIVVRSLSDPFVSVEGISGATELGEGKIVLIIDAPSLIRSTIVKKQLLKTD